MSNLVKEILDLLKNIESLPICKPISIEDWKNTKENLIQSVQQKQKIRNLIAQIYADDKQNAEILDDMLRNLRWEFLEYIRFLDIEPLLTEVWHNSRENLAKKAALYNKNYPLQIQQDKQILLKDAYIFSVLPNYIVVNNAYRGLTILNKQLVFVRNILIFPNILIDEMYVHPEKNETILYCYENACFIWVNAKDGNFFIIDIPKELLIYPKPFYIWEKNEILFSSKNNTFFVLNLLKRSIKKKSPTMVKKNHPQFFMHSQYIDKHQPKTTISDQPIVIFRDDHREEGIIVNTETKIEVSFPHEYDFYCFAHYHNLYKYMIICEYSISFIDDKGHYLATLDSDTCKNFRHTFYFEDDGFITLIYDYSDTSRDNILRIYRLKKQQE